MNTGEHFDGVAECWDENPERVELAERIAAKLLKQVELDRSMEVLDFGCGTGLFSLPWAGCVKSLTGLDPSARMLARFAEKARQAGLSNVQTLEADPAGAVPGRYDLIVSSMVFHHVENVGALLKNLYAALKPGGWLYVADLDPDAGLFHSGSAGIFHDGFNRAELCQLGEQAGFGQLSTTTATEVVKIAADGREHGFSIFLMGGQKV